jgi:hypothetical protein
MKIRHENIYTLIESFGKFERASVYKRFNADKNDTITKMFLPNIRLITTLFNPL